MGEREFVFDDVRQKVLGWQLGACDIAWNDFMGWFVVRHPDLFRGKSVMEVGSGCGIIGLVAAHFADSVLLTDGDEAELPLIQRNAELYSPSTCKVEAEFHHGL